jgi:adenosylcobyric acid synthase
VAGYEIHHGQVERRRGTRPWLCLDGEPEGATAVGPRPALGSSLHGLFEADGLRAALLGAVAARRGRTLQPSGISFAAARGAQLDRLADLVEHHLDLTAIDRLIQESA